MAAKYNNYEYEKKEVTRHGDDFRDWIINVRNSETQNEFQYRISITGTALACRDLETRIQNAVDSEGESLVQEWLEEGKEQKIQCIVSTMRVAERILRRAGPWIDWCEFDRLKEIVEKRLIKIPIEIKKLFPNILLKSGVSYYELETNDYLLLVFNDEDERQRIDELSKMGYHPFPGLIAEGSSSMPAAFKFEKSRNIYLRGSSVQYMYSLDLGKDSSIILCEHEQIIRTPELSDYRYVVDLAYLISFGEEINPVNKYDFIDELITYSIKQWRV